MVSIELVVTIQLTHITVISIPRLFRNTYLITFIIVKWTSLIDFVNTYFPRLPFIPKHYKWIYVITWKDIVAVVYKLYSP